jgi:hypothetical protein
MKFRAEILDELARHGLRPGPETSPAILRDQINDLYRYEIRQLRDRCRAGEFSTRDLPKHVVALRKRYMLLSIPMDSWVEQGNPGPGSME